MYLNPSPIAYLVLALAIIGSAILIPSYLRARSEKETGKGRKLFLLVVRLVCIALLVLVSFDPRAGVHEDSVEPMEIAVLVDTSKSMETMGYRDATRWANVREEVEQLIPNLSKHHIPKIYTFGSALAAVNKLPDSPDALESNLSSALEEVLRVSRDRKLGAVVVLSDGQVADMAPVRNVARRLKKRNIPVYGINYGKELEEPDVALLDATMNQPLLHERRLQLVTTIQSAGFEGERTLLTVSQQDRVVHEEEVFIKEGRQTHTTTFMVSADGFQSYDVALRKLDGERLANNNTVSSAVYVKREKIRVLYMEGSHHVLNVLPMELSKDPAIEVETMFVVQKYREKGRLNYSMARSMIMPGTSKKIYNVTHPTNGVPTNKKDIFKYDVIILSDIFKEAFTEQQIEAFVEFVEEQGGGFVMVGGDTAFGKGDYDETLIDRILPVEIKLNNDTSSASIRAGITEEGLRHPIMQIEKGEKENKLAWKGLPRFSGMNLVDRAKPGATTLAHLPGSKDTVIWAVQEIGKGRSMAFTPDTTPDWGTEFERFGTSKDQRKYYRAFWNNTIRWLAANRLAKKGAAAVEIQLPKRCVASITAPVTITYSEHFQPSGPPTLTVTSPNGVKDKLSVTSNTASNYASFLSSFVPSSPGKHMLTLRTETTDGPAFYKQLVYVSEVGQELSSTKAKPDTLKQLSAITGGKVIRMHKGDAWVDLFSQWEHQVTRYQDRSIWDRWWALLILITLLSLDWFMRRRWGFA